MDDGYGENDDIRDARPQADLIMAMMMMMMMIN
jgi:hypothetical protein